MDLIKQIPTQKWNSHYDTIDLCDPGISVVNFVHKYGIDFERVEEDGLGLCHYACIEIDNSILLLFGTSDENCCF